MKASEKGQKIGRKLETSCKRTKDSRAEREKIELKSLRKKEKWVKKEKQEKPHSAGQ